MRINMHVPSRYIRDNFPSPTDVIYIGLHELSSNPCIPQLRRSLLAPPYIAVLPRIFLVNYPLTDFLTTRYGINNNFTHFNKVR